MMQDKHVSHHLEHGSGSTDTRQQPQPQTSPIFRFLDLPVELQFIVLEKFYEHPWDITELTEEEYEEYNDPIDWESPYQSEDEADSESFESGELIRQLPGAFPLSPASPADHTVKVAVGPDDESIDEDELYWKSQKLQLAPLQVSSQFRDIALKAIRNTHAGTLGTKFRTFEPNFFDKGISVITFVEENPIIQPFDLGLMQPIMQRFCNLSQISLGLRSASDVPQTWRVLEGCRLDQVLSRQDDADIGEAAFSDIFPGHDLQALSIGDIKIDFECHFNVFINIVPRAVLARLPNRIRYANVKFQFEVHRRRCSIAKMVFTCSKKDFEIQDMYSQGDYDHIAEGPELEPIVKMLKDAYIAEQEDTDGQNPSPYPPFEQLPIMFV